MANPVVHVWPPGGTLPLPLPWDPQMSNLIPPASLRRDSLRIVVGGLVAEVGVIEFGVVAALAQ